MGWGYPVFIVYHIELVTWLIFQVSLFSDCQHMSTEAVILGEDHKRRTDSTAAFIHLSLLSKQGCFGGQIFWQKLCNFLLVISLRNVAAAAKSLQSCPTLCDPIEGCPPGSPISGIFQAKVLEWGAIAFSGNVNYTQFILYIANFQWDNTLWRETAFVTCIKTPSENKSSKTKQWQPHQHTWDDNFHFHECKHHAHKH